MPRKTLMQMAKAVGRKKKRKGAMEGGRKGHLSKMRSKLSEFRAAGGESDSRGHLAKMREMRARFGGAKEGTPDSYTREMMEAMDRAKKKRRSKTPTKPARRRRRRT